MNEERIRPLAIGVIRRDDQFLLTEFNDRHRNRLLYRPAGGGIEFGEFGEQALVREYQEELGVVITDIHYITMLENMFSFEGRAGHEIVLVYEARFADQSLYLRDYFDGHEMDGSTFKAVWKSLDQIENSVGLLVPENLPEALHRYYGDKLKK